MHAACCDLFTVSNSYALLHSFINVFDTVLISVYLFVVEAADKCSLNLVCLALYLLMHYFYMPYHFEQIIYAYLCMYLKCFLPANLFQPDD